MESRPPLKRPPNYLSRRLQMRLGSVVLGLGLVAILIDYARRPETWNAFFPPDRQAAPETEVSSAASAETGEIDTRHHPEAGAEQAIRIEPKEEAAAPEKHGPFETVTLPASLARTFKDDTYLRSAEHHAFFEGLRRVREATPQLWKATTTRPVSFAQLYRQSAEFRGSSVSLTGEIRAAFPVTAPKNAYGVDKYYQAWIFPAGQNAPVVVYFLELPQDLPAGANLRGTVEFKGIYLKRWSYLSQEGLRLAPLLVARAPELVHLPSSRATSSPIDSLPTFLLTATVCAAIAVGLSWWIWHKAPHAARPTSPRKRFLQAAVDRAQAAGNAEIDAGNHADSGSAP